MANLLRNAIITPDGTFLQSWSRHDIQFHKDKTNGKRYMVDGGLSYLRRSANGDEVEASVYDDQPHERARNFAKWGTYGKTGQEKLKFITVAEMETDHIAAVLDECEPAPGIKNVMMNEIKGRMAGKLERVVIK